MYASRMFRFNARNLGLCFRHKKIMPLNKCWFSQDTLNKRQQQSNIQLQRAKRMMKDFELDYQNSHSSITEQSLYDEKLILKHKIIKKLQQYMIFLSENQQILNEYLLQIEITSDEIKNDLKALIQQLQEFIKRSHQMQIYDRKIKKQILQFVYEQILHHFNQDDPFYKLAYILQLQIKLKSAFNYFQYCLKPQKNILNSDPQLYIHVWNKINYITFEDEKKIEEGYKNVQKILHALSGAVYKNPNKEQNFIESISFSYNLLKYYMKYELGLLSSLRMLRTPTIESTIKYLDLYEFGIYKHLSSFSFPKIQTNQMMYIPLGQYQEGVDIFEQNKDSISVRILYYQQLPLIKTEFHQNWEEQINDIIIHMHGGGFVGLSSHTTQNYTRIWANQLKMPLFSIDYRMPPEHSFPTAPQDCFHVYKFLLNHIHKYMKIRPKNIYLCGDSAGGNLSCALTALAIKNKVMIPKGLYIVYSLLDSTPQYYPSRKYLLHDPILWPPMAELFRNSYLQKKQNATNPLASPLLLTEEFVGGQQNDKRFPLSWPITYMAVGSMDLLRDQHICFLQKMVESDINCKLTIFQHLRHAMFSTSKMIKQSQQSLEYSVVDFKQMIERSKND